MNAQLDHRAFNVVSTLLHLIWCHTYWNVSSWERLTDSLIKPPCHVSTSPQPLHGLSVYCLFHSLFPNLSVKSFLFCLSLSVLPLSLSSPPWHGFGLPLRSSAQCYPISRVHLSAIPLFRDWQTMIPSITLGKTTPAWLAIHPVLSTQDQNVPEEAWNSFQPNAFFIEMRNMYHLISLLRHMSLITERNICFWPLLRHVLFLPVLFSPLLSPLIHITDKCFRAALIGGDGDRVNSSPSSDPLQAINQTRWLFDESYGPLRGSKGSGSGTPTQAFRESVTMAWHVFIMDLVDGWLDYVLTAEVLWCQRQLCSTQQRSNFFCVLKYASKKRTQISCSRRSEVSETTMSVRLKCVALTAEVLWSLRGRWFSNSPTEQARYLTSLGQICGDEWHRWSVDSIAKFCS